MEVSKINNLSFGCVHKPNKEFNIQPNNKNNGRKNKTALILLALAATGACLAAGIIKKQKTSDINNVEKTAETITSQLQNQEKTVNNISENVPEKLNPDTVLAEKQTPPVIQDEVILPVNDKIEENTSEINTFKTKRISRTERRKNEIALSNAKINTPYIEKIIQNSKEFEAFGTDAKFTDALKEVNPEMVKSMDNEFLSIILAPRKNMSVDFYEVMSIQEKKNKVSEFMNNTVLKFSKKARNKQIRNKRLDVFNYVGSISSDESRVEKLKKLDSTFTVGEIKNAFNDKNQRINLLKWLIGFNTTFQERLLLDKLTS